MDGMVIFACMLKARTQTKHDKGHMMNTQLYEYSVMRNNKIRSQEENRNAARRLVVKDYQAKSRFQLPSIAVLSLLIILTGIIAFAVL